MELVRHAWVNGCGFYLCLMWGERKWWHLMRYLCDGEDCKWWDSNTVPKLSRQLLELVNVRGNQRLSWPALAGVGPTLFWAGERWNANARGEKPLRIKAGSPVGDVLPKLTAIFDSLGKALVWTLLIFEEIRSLLTKLIFRSTKFVLVAPSTRPFINIPNTFKETGNHMSEVASSIQTINLGFGPD